MKEIKLNHKSYPKQLLAIKNSPKRLFVEGNMELLNGKCIAVVGSRNCTEYGKKWCKYFVKELVKYDLTIVSGMAIGIDSIAHNTAINYGGKTIAVLPSGLENIFPLENNKLYNAIIKCGGCVISEYLPKSKANSKKFLERNRIVSGLSSGLLVVEAAYRSGTSVTARFAKKQGRDVFCIPGSLDNPKSIGTNKLIKEFAKIATSPLDILVQFGIINEEVGEKNITLKEDISNIPIEYRKVYAVITQNPMDVNEISKKSNFSVREVTAKLTMLELEGKIKKVAGNRYVRDI